MEDTCMQDPKKTQASIETEEQKLRTKQQSTMNFVMLAAKDLAQAKIDYEKSLQTKTDMVNAKSALDSATENYNLFKEQADEINKLLKPYDELNAYNKQLGTLRDQKTQLQREIDELSGSTKTTSERKGSGASILLSQTTRKDSSSKPPEPERKRTLTQSIVGLVSTKSSEKDMAAVSEKIKEKEEARQNVEKAIRDLEHKRFFITIQSADANKLAFDKSMLVNEQKKMTARSDANPNLLKDTIFIEQTKQLSDKIQAITDLQTARQVQASAKSDNKIILTHKNP